MKGKEIKNLGLKAASLKYLKKQKLYNIMFEFIITP